MKVRFTLVTMLLLVFGASEVYAAKRLAPPPYRSQTNEVAAKALLQQALTLAGDGSWERIAVGRVYYLAGMKNEGQVIFDQVLSNEEPSDLFRVARVYLEAGEWPRAKALLDKAVQLDPQDENGLAEAGAYYLLQGDRATAEALFDRAFKKGDEIWVAVSAAGGYLGVKPQE